MSDRDGETSLELLLFCIERIEVAKINLNVRRIQLCDETLRHKMKVLALIQEIIHCLVKFQR